jgi:hypothetical protein
MAPVIGKANSQYLTSGEALERVDAISGESESAVPCRRDPCRDPTSIAIASVDPSVRVQAQEPEGEMATV